VGSVGAGCPPLGSFYYCLERGKKDSVGPGIYKMKACVDKDINGYVCTS